MKRLILTIFYCLLTICPMAQAASEIRAFVAGASTCFAVVREVDGDVWYVTGQVFEAWGTAARTAADYDIALVDKTGDMFVGTMDTNIGAGQYYIVSFQQEGGSPADSDPAVWQEYGDWDGSSWSAGNINVNITQISGDSTAADNLELQYDTTGLAGDTFPATQAQIGNIANVGTAVNQTPSSYTLTTGVQSSGTVSSTEELDGVNHEHTGATVMDLYYEFTIGSGIPETVVMTGYLNGNNDDLEVYGYDWVSVGWKQIGTLAGKAQSTNEVNAYDMFVNMVGNGANEGIVRVRFTDGAFTLSSATLAIDQIFISFSLGMEGYDNGAIWINTNVSNTNVVVGIDGTSRNPVSTMAAANTLAASTNLDHFEIAPNSTITFAAPQENQTFNGEIWTLALGGQSVSGSHIIGADVSGICTGATEPRFLHCHFGTVTIPPADMERCVLESTVTAGSAGTFFFEKCQSGIAGTSTPVFDFGSGLNSSNVNFRDYSGGIEIRYMGEGTGTYNMSLEGFGQLVIASNCSATSTIAIRGHFTVTDNASNAVTLSNLAMFDHHDIINLIQLEETTVKDANDPNNFTINGGIDANDVFWYSLIQVEDADDLHREERLIFDYTFDGTDPNITVDEPFSFPPAVGDRVWIVGTGYIGTILDDIWQNLLHARGVLNVIDDTKGAGTSVIMGVTRIDAQGDDP